MKLHNLDTVLGTVKTTSSTSLMQSSMHTTVYIRNPQIQQKIINLSPGQWHINLRHQG